MARKGWPGNGKDNDEGDERSAARMRKAPPPLFAFYLGVKERSSRSLSGFSRRFSAGEESIGWTASASIARMRVYLHVAHSLSPLEGNAILGAEARTLLPRRKLRRCVRANSWPLTTNFWNLSLVLRPCHNFFFSLSLLLFLRRRDIFTAHRSDE